MSTQPTALFDRTDPSSPTHYSASQTAVLLLDFHGLFLHGPAGPQTTAALQQAIKLRTWAKQQGILVVHALVDVNAKPFPTCKGAARLLATIDSLRENPEYGMEAEGLRVDGYSADEPLLTRTPGFVSALRSEGFDEVVAARGIRSLVLCGLSTSGCVMRTAFSASDAEFVVTVVEDGCADPKEGLHEVLVESVLPARSYCCRLERFVAEWEGRGGE